MFPTVTQPAHFDGPLDRILIRGVNWLGDAVMTIPALLRLREAYPKAHIVLLTPAKLEELWLHQPSVDAVISFAPTESVWSIGRKLRRGQFDLALVLPNSHRSALEVFLAGIPRRVGYRRLGRNVLLTHPVPARPGEFRMVKRPLREIRQSLRSRASRSEAKPPPTTHHLFQYLHLVATLGANPEPMAPQLMLTEPERQEAIQLLKATAMPPPFWVGLNPGAEYGPAKRWPLERFVAAATQLNRETHCGCVVLGGVNDIPVAREIAMQLSRAEVFPVVNLAGRTTLRQLCGVLNICEVVLTNDSGPMHVAAAVGTSVVVSFGSTLPELTGPGLPGNAEHQLISATVPCSPCFRSRCPIDLRCMKSITVQQVVTAVKKLL